MSEAIEFRLNILPKLALEEAKRLNRTAVAAGEEAISPTELGVWGPKTLKIGQNMGWHRAFSDAYRDLIRHSRQPNRV